MAASVLKLPLPAEGREGVSSGEQKCTEGALGWADGVQSTQRSFVSGASWVLFNSPGIRAFCAGMEPGSKPNLLQQPA